MKPLAVSLAAALVLAACSNDPREAPPRAADASVDTAGARSLTAAAEREKENERWKEIPELANPAEFLSFDSMKWGGWEKAVGDKEGELRRLGVRIVRGEGVEQRLEHFHFVDFSGDGVADVIYAGPAIGRSDSGEVWAREGDLLLMWQVTDGRAVQVFEHYGTLQRIWGRTSHMPSLLRVIQYGCCAETSNFIEYLDPEPGARVRYAPRARILHSTHHPAVRSPFRHPRPFTVNADRYTLRFTPEISSAPGFDWEGRGNASADYGRGARGVALAEARDATGRVWWYVLMDGDTPPLAAAYVEEPGSPVPLDRLGWMSSRFLSVAPTPWYQVEE
ncbi:MAG TPA: hypothetical protein VFR81_06230 [Longimicrobium sp.]|nr:hypothetical protein [Longimicrobium sp.]